MLIERAASTANDTLDATSDTLIAGMTLTPAANDYFLFFTTEILTVADAGSELNTFSVYVGGVQIDHTERIYEEDPSIRNANIMVAINCKVSPNGSQDVEIRHRTTNVASPLIAQRRELNLFPITGTDVEISATDEATLATATWTALLTATTPAAGDYLLAFSTSGQGPADSELGFRVTVGGNIVAHSLRTVFMESSAPDEVVILIAIQVTPDGTEDVVIEWARVAGSGTIMVHARTLNLIPTAAADIFEAFGTVDDTDSTNDDVLIDDMTITDPGIADYLVIFSATDFYGDIANNKAETVYSIRVGGVKVTDSGRMNEHEASLDNTRLQVIAGGRARVVGATDDIEMFWQNLPSNEQRTIHERTMVAIRATGTRFMVGESSGQSSVKAAVQTIIRTGGTSFGYSDSQAIVTPANQLFVSRSGLVLWEKWDREDVVSDASNRNTLRNGWKLQTHAVAGQILDRRYSGLDFGAFNINVLERREPTFGPFLSAPFTKQIAIQEEAICQINHQLPGPGQQQADILLRLSGGTPSTPNNFVGARTNIDSFATGTWNSRGTVGGVPKWNTNTLQDTAVISGSAIALRLVVGKFIEGSNRIGGRTYGKAGLSSLQDLTQDLTFFQSGTFDVVDGNPPENNIMRFELRINSLMDDLFICGRNLMFSGLPVSHSVQIEGRAAIFETGSIVTQSVDSFALPIQVSMSLLSASVEISTLPSGSEVWGGSTITFGFGPTEIFAVDVFGSSITQGRGGVRMSIKGTSEGESLSAFTGSRKTAEFKEAFSNSDSDSHSRLGIMFTFAGSEVYGQSLSAATGSRKTAIFKEAFINGSGLAEAFGIKRLGLFSIVHGDSWVSRGEFTQTAQFISEIHGTAYTDAQNRTLLQLSSDGAASLGDALNNARLGIRVPFGQRVPEMHGGSFVEAASFFKTASLEAIVDGDSVVLASVKVRLVLGICELRGDSLLFDLVRMTIIRDPTQITGVTLGQSQFELLKLGFRYLIVQPAGGFNPPICVFLDGDAPICILLPSNEAIPITLETLERIGITIEDLERVPITVEDETKKIQLPVTPFGDD